MRGKALWALPMLVVVVLAAGVTTGIALGQGEGSDEPGAGPPAVSNQAAETIAEYCPPEINSIGPSATCRVVDLNADASSELQKAADHLAEARGAAECPEARAVFERAGAPVHAFIGRCPTAPEAAQMLRRDPRK